MKDNFMLLAMVLLMGSCLTSAIDAEKYYKNLLKQYESRGTRKQVTPDCINVRHTINLFE